MSAQIYIFPIGRVERCGERPPRRVDAAATVSFTVLLREEVATEVISNARTWGCTPEQYLAETLEDLIPFGSGT